MRVKSSEIIRFYLLFITWFQELIVLLLKIMLEEHFSTGKYFFIYGLFDFSKIVPLLFIQECYFRINYLQTYSSIILGIIVRKVSRVMLKPDFLFAYKISIGA